MTPEMWLDLEPIPHRASRNFAADRQNPSGIRHGVALLVAWLDFTRSTREGCHLLSCDGVTVGRVGTPKLFTICMPSATGCVALPLQGRCGSDESCLGYGSADETARGQHSVLVRALLGFIGRTAGG